MQRIAYGLLNLKPDEFWSLTLKEYTLMVEGFNKKEDMDWKKNAQLASWIIQPHMKKPVKASDLYDPKAKDKKKTTPEETARMKEELDDVFGKAS